MSVSYANAPLFNLECVDMTLTLFCNVQLPEKYVGGDEWNLLTCIYMICFSFCLLKGRVEW